VEGVEMNDKVTSKSAITRDFDFRSTGMFVGRATELRTAERAKALLILHFQATNATKNVS
jgi:hypothetical protein